jgi:plasmid stabilization system protein ParE
MPIRAVDFDPRAVREISAASRWYAHRSPAAAQGFLAAVGQAVQRITAAAERASPFGRRFRLVRLRRFPYLLYYEIRDPQAVLIYALSHVSADPGYWLRRTRP